MLAAILVNHFVKFKSFLMKKHPYRHSLIVMISWGKSIPFGYGISLITKYVPVTNILQVNSIGSYNMLKDSPISVRHLFPSAFKYFREIPYPGGLEFP